MNDCYYLIIALWLLGIILCLHYEIRKGPYLIKRKAFIRLTIRALLWPIWIFLGFSLALIRALIAFVRG